MKTIRGLGLAGLLVALVLALASCGNTGSPAGGNDGSKDMDHGSMGRGDGINGGTAGMNHSGTDGQEMARRMLMDRDGDYSDRLFIDMMVPHHQGAVEMAEVALKNAEHEEILQLSRNIVRTQEAEVEELKYIKREEFGTAAVPMDMGDGQMRGMGMTMDPKGLAKESPFDRAFIDAMIPHHVSAVDMANVALQESDNPRLRKLAENIISAQKREIADMKEWRREWYP